MKNESGTIVTAGTPVLTLLGVAFVVLKLTGFIEWGWFWVLLPLMITPALVILALLGCGLLILWAMLVK